MSTYIRPVIKATTTITHTATTGLRAVSQRWSDSPGYGSSEYVFTAVDSAASSYVENDLSQALQFYMVDAHAIPTPQTYVQAYADGKLIASGKASDAGGSPIVWLPLSGTFTAGSGSATLTVKFIATDYLGVKWSLDNVVVTKV
ncbi:MAG: hypothetical protein Q9166_003497 [cf. Caloplaca sp. 2 TL-2023]